MKKYFSRPGDILCRWRKEENEKGEKVRKDQKQKQKEQGRCRVVCYLCRPLSYLTDRIFRPHFLQALHIVSSFSLKFLVNSKSCSHGSLIPSIPSPVKCVSWHLPHGVVVRITEDTVWGKMLCKTIKCFKHIRYASHWSLWTGTALPCWYRADMSGLWSESEWKQNENVRSQINVMDKKGGARE